MSSLKHTWVHRWKPLTVRQTVFPSDPPPVSCSIWTPRMLEIVIVLVAPLAPPRSLWTEYTRHAPVSEITPQSRTPPFRSPPCRATTCESSTNSRLDLETHDVWADSVAKICGDSNNDAGQVNTSLGWFCQNRTPRKRVRLIVVGPMEPSHHTPHLSVRSLQIFQDSPWRFSKLAYSHTYKPLCAIDSMGKHVQQAQLCLHALSEQTSCLSRLVVGISLVDSRQKIVFAAPYQQCHPAYGTHP